MHTLGSAWWRLVKFGFRLLYNEMAWTYDLVSWTVSLGEWRSWQRAALKHLVEPSTALILEVAHGTANLQLDMHAAGYRTLALDFSPYMGRIARRKLTRRGIAARLLRGRAQGLPFPAGAFCNVVSTFPTEFIVDPATLAEVYRVLRPGGRLIFVPNGVLTGRGPLRDGIEAAYRATGQHGGWDGQILARFTQAGFTLRVVTEPCRKSLATVVIAEKAAVVDNDAAKLPDVIHE